MGDTSLIITKFNFQQLRKLMAAGAMTKSSVQVYCKNKSLYSKCCLLYTSPSPRDS